MEHTCHAIGCNKAVHPKYLMCPSDWRLVPQALKNAVWDEYVPGQEQRKDPTIDYLAAAHRAILAVADRKGTHVPPALRARWLEPTA